MTLAPHPPTPPAIPTAVTLEKGDFQLYPPADFHDMSIGQVSVAEMLEDAA